ncbi:FAD-dependent oxidoreductase [Verrucomicrobiales bacterium]|nr:FAD-dependent oxidoreductase [Verrucomicrobiales bacterium]
MKKKIVADLTLSRKSLKMVGLIDRNLLIQGFFIGASVRPGLRGCKHDITGKGQGAIHHPDTIAVGEFPIDSFPCRNRQPTDTIVLEGYLGMLDHITRPYEIPYRIMIPKEIDGIIVPVAASTTHVAFSSIRMEPTWMALGQAAGTAAHLAIERDKLPRKVPITELQELLSQQGQVLKHSKN